MTDRRPIHVDDEARIAEEMARELEDVAARSQAVPPAGFADRIMAAVAQEPLPQPARAFGTALAARRLGAALGSVGDAWRVVLSGRVPFAVRAQALALVLVVAAGSLAVAGGATVGAIDLLNANQPAHPSPTAPQPSEPQESPSPSPSTSPSTTAPEPSTEPAPTSEATETPEATDNAGSTPRSETATPRATGTDDHGGGSGTSGATPTPTGTDDGGGSGGGEDTPKPTATGTDGHGGGGGDG